MKLKDINFWDITKSLMIIIAVLFIGYHIHGFINSMHAANRNMQEQIISISESAMKIEGRVASNTAIKELKTRFAEEKSEILSAFEAQRKHTGETLDELGQVKAELKRTRQLNISTDKIYKKETQDKKHWYFFKKIMVKGKDGENVPYAWVMFYPWREPDKQWKTGTYELTMDTKVIESQNDDGSFNRYAEVDLLGKGGKELPVKLTELQWEKIELREKRFHWWNPRLGLSTQFSDGLAYGLNISLASYGKTKRDISFRFITFGTNIQQIDKEKSFNLSLEPLSWNIGEIIPLIENLFVGPAVIYDPNKEVQYGLQFSIPF